jgi:glutathione S-transferase
MPPLILYHYPLSPFSEKVRAMLGWTQLPWQSVTVREMPPRPLLESLAGGYRRVPVAQIGADVFCDTRTIAAEIARRARRPALALERCRAEVQAYAREVDLDIFLACMACANTPAMGRRLLRSMPLQDIPRFLWDRVSIGRKASLSVSLLRNPRRVVLDHLQALEARLTQDFLFGAQPNHADFSAYHGLWFLRDMGGSALTRDFPRVNAWMDRIQAFGAGPRTDIDGAQALALAREATPRRIAAAERADPLIGRAVHIEPADYAQARTHGVLAGASATRWILAREDAALGRLHVHFPKAGYRLLPAAA